MVLLKDWAYHLGFCGLGLACKAANPSRNFNLYILVYAGLCTATGQCVAGVELNLLTSVSSDFVFASPSRVEVVCDEAGPYLGPQCGFANGTSLQGGPISQSLRCSLNFKTMLPTPLKADTLRLRDLLRRLLAWGVSTSDDGLTESTLP